MGCTLSAVDVATPSSRYEEWRQGRLSPYRGVAPRRLATSGVWRYPATDLLCVVAPGRLVRDDQLTSTRRLSLSGPHLIW